MTRVAIYARVSTSKQEADVQVAQLEAFAERMGWVIVATLRETEHGWEPDREQLRKLLDLASRREIDVALVWALDRFSRQGVAATLSLLERLHATGVSLWSFREPFLRETDPKVAELLLSILAWAAKQEHVRISERTKAALELVRAERRSYGAPKGSRPIGRAPKYVFDAQRARALRQGGMSWTKVAEALDLPRNALASVRRACQNGSRAGPSESGVE